MKFLISAFGECRPRLVERLIAATVLRRWIHPRTPPERISAARARRLHSVIIEILTTAIKHKGSSISDYVDGLGERGSFQQLHNVYGRSNEPCPRCGTKIRRIVIGQRGTHYCPRCQRV